MCGENHHGSKEKQIEEKNCKECLHFEACNKWTDFPKQLGYPTCGHFRKQIEWISVEERLPDHCGLPVLMVAVNPYNQMRVVKGFTDYQCPITFHTNEREYDGVWRAWEVTHWMPLPEPPKMKGGAE